MNNIAEKEILKRECYALFPYLITITDTTTEEVFNYVNMDSDLDVEVDGETVTFEGKAFSVEPGKKSEDDIGDGSLTIYDVATEWIPRIRNKSLEHIYEIEFKSMIKYMDNGSWELEILSNENYTLKDFSWSDNGAIKCTMVFDENMDINMPIDTLDSLICPALF